MPPPPSFIENSDAVYTIYDIGFTQGNDVDSNLESIESTTVYLTDSGKQIQVKHAVKADAVKAVWTEADRVGGVVKVVYTFSDWSTKLTYSTLVFSMHLIGQHCRYDHPRKFSCRFISDPTTTILEPLNVDYYDYDNTGSSLDIRYGCHAGVKKTAALPLKISLELLIPLEVAGQYHRQWTLYGSLTCRGSRAAAPPAFNQLEPDELEDNDLDWECLRSWTDAYV